MSNKMLLAAGLAAVLLPTGAAIAAEGSAEAGARKNEMCIGCHGIYDYKTTFPRVYRVPMISGQSAKYLEAALHEYKKGDRSNMTMRAIASGLSDQDMADLAAYYGSK